MQLQVFQDEGFHDTISTQDHCSDVPHLMKTVRNCWANSFGHSNTRKMEVRKLNNLGQ